MAAKVATRWASNFLQRRVHYRRVPPNFILNVCRNCHATTAEDKNDNTQEETTLKKQDNEERRRRRDEGKQLHAVYHMKVDEIAAEFLMKRQEEEKHLSHEMQKKRELQKLEEEMHDRVIESVHLENERVQQLRKDRLENKKLKDDERNKEEELLRKEHEEKQQQERIELVKNMIEESKNWVTLENLEEKIAHCLENEINYNFALSPSGEKHYSTSPPGCIDTEENAPGPAAYSAGLPSKPGHQEADLL